MIKRSYIPQYDEIGGWVLVFLIAMGAGRLVSLLLNVSDPLIWIDLPIIGVIAGGIVFRQRWSYYAWITYALGTIFFLVLGFIFDPSLMLEAEGFLDRPLVIEVIPLVLWTSYFLFSYRVYSLLLATDVERSQEFKTLSETEQREKIQVARQKRSNWSVAGPVIVGVVGFSAIFIYSAVAELMGDPEIWAISFAESIQEELPIQYGDNLSWVSASAKRQDIVYRFEWDTSFSQLTDEGWDIDNLDHQLSESALIDEYWCQSMEENVWLVEATYSVRLVLNYFDKQGNPIGTAMISKADCSSGGGPHNQSVQTDQPTAGR